jgi:hypothetical protein
VYPASTGEGEKKMTQSKVIVSACDANSEVRVEDRGENEGRVVVVAEQSGDCWYDRAAYRVPISQAKAQGLIDSYARFVAGPVQARFMDAATGRR